MKEETIHFIVYSFFRSFIICFILTPIKLNDLVDLVCVLFTLVQIPSSRTQYRRRVRGKKISERKQRWKKITKWLRRTHFMLEFQEINNILLYDHMLLAVSHFSNSTLVFLLSLFTPCHDSAALVSWVVWLMVEVISQGST